MSPWTYQGQPFESAPEDSFGFVYRITLPDGRKYIGKKGFWSNSKTSVVKVSAKGKGRVKDMSPEEQAARLKTRRVTKESDWRKYFSYGEEIKRIIAAQGTEGFQREILQLVPARGLLSYYELVWQLRENAILRSDYLNGIINVRLNRGCFPQWLRDQADAEAAV